MAESGLAPSKRTRPVNGFSFSWLQDRVSEIDQRPKPYPFPVVVAGRDLGDERLGVLLGEQPLFGLDRCVRRVRMGVIGQPRKYLRCLLTRHQAEQLSGRHAVGKRIRPGAIPNPRKQFRPVGVAPQPAGDDPPNLMAPDLSISGQQMNDRRNATKIEQLARRSG